MKKLALGFSILLCASIAQAQWNTVAIPNGPPPTCDFGRLTKVLAFSDAIAETSCASNNFGATGNSRKVVVCMCAWTAGASAFEWQVVTRGAGGGGTPGGSDTQVQYNNAGAFGGDAGMTYNAGTDTLTVPNITGNSSTSTLATTATTANAGDSATAFFSSGTIESARLPAFGDVVGPASAVDNAITRFDLTTGKLVQGSTLFISDGGILGFTGLTAGDVGLSDAGGTLNVRLADDSGWSQARSKGYETYGTSNTSQRSSYIFGETPFKEIAMDSGFWVNWSASSTAAGSGDVGFSRVAAGVLRATGSDKAVTGGWIQTAGFKRKAADQTVTDSTTLVSDSDLTSTLSAGRSYGFRFHVLATVVTTSGLKVAIGGTATHTDLISDLRMYDYSIGGDVAGDLVDSTTAGNHTIGSSVIGGTKATVIVEGTTTIANAGTLLIQFAQNAETVAAESAIALRGSTLTVWDLP